MMSGMRTVASDIIHDVVDLVIEGNVLVGNNISYALRLNADIANQQYADVLSNQLKERVSSVSAEDLFDVDSTPISQMIDYTHTRFCHNITDRSDILRHYIANIDEDKKMQKRLADDAELKKNYEDFRSKLLNSNPD